MAVVVMNLTPDKYVLISVWVCDVCLLFLKLTAELDPISAQLVPEQLVHYHVFWPGLGYLQELYPVQAMLAGMHVFTAKVLLSGVFCIILFLFFFNICVMFCILFTTEICT